MSAKQEKRLRQAARGLAVTLDQAGRTIHARGLLAVEHREMNVSSILSSSPSPDQIVDDPRGPVYAVTAVNRPDSLRGIIRSLKKGVKSGAVSKPPAAK